MGNHALARLLGKGFGLANAAFVLASAVHSLLYAHGEAEAFSALLSCFVIGYLAFEVWSFTHGRPTFIDSFRHEATPDRTSWRVFGLLLDLALWYLFIREIKSW